MNGFSLHIEPPSYIGKKTITRLRSKSLYLGFLYSYIFSDNIVFCVLVLYVPDNKTSVMSGCFNVFWVEHVLS